MATAQPFKDSEKRPEILYRSIVSSVGTTSTATEIDLPDGAYYLYFFGTQTAGATTDPTLTFNPYTDQARGATSTTPVFAKLSTDTAHAASVDLELAQTSLLGSVSMATTAITPIPLPYGIKTVYAKKESTAVNLTLMAVRAR